MGFVMPVGVALAVDSMSLDCSPLGWMRRSGSVGERLAAFAAGVMASSDSLAAGPFAAASVVAAADAAVLEDVAACKDLATDRSLFSDLVSTLALVGSMVAAEVSIGLSGVSVGSSAASCVRTDPWMRGRGRGDSGFVVSGRVGVGLAGVGGLCRLLGVCGLGVIGLGFDRLV